MVSPRAIAQHAADLRLMSLYSDLEHWIEQAADQMRDRTAEGDIADAIHTGLFELRAKLDPMIERLARREAEREAADQSEFAADAA